MSKRLEGNPRLPIQDLMTVDELVAYQQFSMSLLFKLAHQDKVLGQQIGKHWRFHIGTIDNWLAKWINGEGQT